MYSRSQGREQKRTDYDERDCYDDMCDEEYELYRYNLPPKYDGSRFRRNSRRHSSSHHEPRPESNKSDSNMAEQGMIAEEHVHREEETVCETKETEHLPLPIEHKVSEDGGIQNLLSRFGDRLGYEEILIIALILMIAGDDKSDGDIILLLALLLLEH